MPRPGLPTRKIGTTEVTAIGFGAMGLSVGYGTPPPDEERFKVRIIVLRVPATDVIKISIDSPHLRSS